MPSSDRSGLFGPHPTDALIALLVVALAVVAATTADVQANEAWTLVAALAAAYIVGRGLSRGDWLAVAPRPHRPAHTSLPGGDGNGDARDPAEIMLREERVHVESRIRPRERIVVRKHVITEHVRVMVPVRREELIVERVPLDAPSDPGAELDLTLMEDEPVVHTRTERFRANITPTNEETAR